MKKLPIVIIVLFWWVAGGSADTFTHKKTGEILYGFAIQKKINNKKGTPNAKKGVALPQTVVRTTQKGIQRLDLAEYDVKRDYEGRRNKVILIPLKEEIILNAETEAFEKALINASNRGPLFIIVEIDSPGGRIDLCQRICTTIESIDNCDVVAYIGGGKYGGAYSAAAAVALACDEIYMADNTAIGAATPYVPTPEGLKDLRQAYGAEQGNEMLSQFSGFFASLAERNDKPALLASAMVDKEIEVVEVTENERRRFVTPPGEKADKNLSAKQLSDEQIAGLLKKGTRNVVRTWSKKGSLLTRSPAEAVKCTIAEAVMNSTAELLGRRTACAPSRPNPASSAVIVSDNSPLKARQSVEKAKRRIDKAIADAERHIGQLANAKTRDRALGVLSRLILDLNDAIGLAEKYPDLHYNVPAIKDYKQHVEEVADKVHSGGF